MIHLVGKAERKREGRAEAHRDDQRSTSSRWWPSATARPAARPKSCFAELIADELTDRGVAYVIVNEAGASVYSTSPLGREEFPEYDATLRGAISIGRRLQDPLSELVKIDPANIGVGMYQHDVKAKHLQTSLDEVVESCVNYVGVDVNTASPALLRYVSGLNQLTARRLYEYRTQHGPFSNREQLQRGARLRRGDVRPGGRLPEDRRRRQPAGRHLDPSGKLRAGRPGARDAWNATVDDLAEKEAAGQHRRTGRARSSSTTLTERARRRRRCC